MKRIILKTVSVILCIMTLFGAAFTNGISGADLFLPRAYAVSSGKCGYLDATWKFDDVTGTLTITGTGDTIKAYSATDLPWYSFRSSVREVVIGGTMQGIGPYSFSGMTRLKKVTLCSTLSFIDKYGFSGCTALEYITLPDSLSDISVYAFKDCTSLKSITIPPKVKRLDYAFSGCTRLSTVNLSEGFSELNAYTFENCISLKTISLPSTLYRIDGDAFLNCSALTEIVLPENISSMGKGAFTGCTSLKCVHIPGLVENIPDGFLGDAKPQHICSDKTDSAAAALAKKKGIQFFTCDCKDHYTPFKRKVLEINGGIKSISLREGNPDSFQITLTEDGVPVDPANYTKKHYSTYTNLYKNGLVTAKHCGTGAIFIYGTDCEPCKIKVIVGHAYTENVTEPTCTQGGSTVYRCSDCSKSYIADQVEPLGHSYVDGICERCGDITQERLLRDAKDAAIAELEEAGSGYFSAEARSVITKAKSRISLAETVEDIQPIVDEALKEAGTEEEILKSVKDAAIASLERLRETVISNEAVIAIEQAITSIENAEYVDSVDFIANRAKAEVRAAESCDNLGHSFENGVCEICGHVQYWEYTITNGNAVITGYYGPDAEVIIPDYLEGAKVTGIAAAAFARNNIIQYVRIPDGVKYIEKFAFLDCVSLKEVYIGESVSSVGDEAFSGCESLGIVCVYSNSIKIGQDSFIGNDPRLSFVVGKGTSSAKTVSEMGFPCITFEFPVMRGNDKAIAFGGEMTLYEDMDYYYWGELAAHCPGAKYLSYEYLELEGVETSVAADSFDENHLDRNAEYVTLKNIYMSIVIDGEVISFDKLAEMLENDYTELILTFDDDDGGKLSLFQRIVLEIRQLFRTITKIVNAVIKVFKKKK